MKTNRRWKARSSQPVVALVLLALIFAGCGGGSGSSNGGGGAEGGIGGTGATFGRITALGSVTVDGSKIETDAETEYELEGRDNRESELEVGLVVKVESTIDDAGLQTATLIEFEDNVEGPVDDISRLSLGELGVLGQTVILDDLTVFEGTTADALQLGNVVEVSGFVDDQGRIQASFLELKADAFMPGPGEELEVQGFASELNAANSTFRIHSLAVSFAGVTPRNGTLANGALVEVKSTQGLVGGELIASDVEIKPTGLGAPEGAEVEIEGFVTDFASIRNFQVIGQVVNAGGAQFVDGDPNDVQDGAKVEVEGTINAAGVLVATKVQIKVARNVKIEADVSSVDPGAGTVTVYASATAGTPGIVVTADGATALEDDRDGASAFGLANLVEGDRVEIRAFQRDDDVIASKVERDDPRDRVRLQGPVTSEDEAGLSLTILGVDVDGSGATFRPDDDGSLTISSTEFFASVGVGTLVKATGTFDAATGVIVADELELEGENGFDPENEFEFEFENGNEFEFEDDDEGEQEFEDERRGRTRGRIDRFGSMFVNDDAIDISGAVIILDDNPGVESDLGVGMQVDVEVRIDDTAGTVRATHIEFDDELQGPITAPVVVTDPTTGEVTGGTLRDGTLEVVEQTVKLDGLTVFADVAGPGSLVLGDIVEVSGSRDASGVLHATRVELKGPEFGDLPEDENQLEIKGVIQSGSLTAGTFLIGDLTVDFSGAAFGPVIADADGLMEGQVVEVRSDQALAGDGSLIASFIKLEDEALFEAEGVEVRIEGLVTAFTFSAEFEVDGQPVTTNAQTTFTRGTADDIALERQLEVEGEMDADNVLVADEVEFELAKNVKIQAEVDVDGVTVNADGTTGTVAVLGIVVTVDNSTLLEDDRDDLSPFGLANLADGDRVGIRAFLDDDGNPVAAKLEREDARDDGRRRLQGPLDDASTAATLIILGAQIDTSTITRFEDELGNRFEDGNGDPDPTAFVAAASDKLVKIRGDAKDDGSFEWKRAEIEIGEEFENETENEFEFEFEDELEDESEDENGG